MHQFVYLLAYENLNQKYGLKKVTDNKFSQILESCYFYQSNSKIKLFSKFVKLIEPLETEDFLFYIKCLKFLDDKMGTGLSIASNSSEFCFCGLVLFFS